jgi:hypothetical protein
MFNRFATFFVTNSVLLSATAETIVIPEPLKEAILALVSVLLYSGLDWLKRKLAKKEVEK